jgi:hypothetical protein
VVLGYFIATADYATLFGRQGQGSIYQELERGHDGIAVKSGGDCFSGRGAAEEVSMAQQSGKIHNKLKPFLLELKKEFAPIPLLESRGARSSAGSLKWS